MKNLKKMNAIWLDAIMSATRKNEELKKELAIIRGATPVTDHFQEIQKLKQINGIFLDEINSQRRKNEILKQELKEKESIIKSLQCTCI